MNEASVHLSSAGNFGAYNSTNTAANNWPVGLGVGMLSSVELEHDIPVCNALKSPTQPVWILHGGDHFTLMWASTAASFPPQTPTTETASFSLYHWNGLPPHGPRMATISVTAPSGAAPPVWLFHEFVTISCACHRHRSWLIKSAQSGSRWTPSTLVPAPDSWRNRECNPGVKTSPCAFMHYFT